MTDEPSQAHALPPFGVADLSGDFSIARIKSRQEKVFLEELRRKDIGYYIPLKKEHRRWAGRRRQVWLPVFPNIAFVATGDEGRRAAENSRCVFGFIPVSPRYQPILRGELINLERLLAVKENIEMFPHLREGREVEVCGEHPFRGIRGFIETRDDKPRNGKIRIYVRVEILGQSTPLEVDAEFLEPCDGESPRPLDRGRLSRRGNRA